MLVMSIDPGPTSSGYTIVDDGLNIYDFGEASNEDLINKIREQDLCDVLVIEMMTSYGMPIGKTSMDTLVWIGKFHEAFEKESVLIARSKIKLHLCHTARAKDKNVIAALKNRFQPTGGGKDPYKGTKNKPGPLYGFKSHIFMALSVAVAYFENCERYSM